MERMINGSFLARHKIALAQIHIVQNREYFVEGNSFAERNQVLLDVAIGIASDARREQECGVVDIELAHASRRISPIVEGARQNASLLFVSSFVQKINYARLPANVIRYGSFSQNNQVRAILDTIVHHADRLFHDGIKTFLAPLGPLLDARLHQGNIRRAFAIRTVKRCRLGFREHDTPLHKQRHKNDRRERQNGSRLFQVLSLAEHIRHSLVRGHHENRIAENTDIREHLDQFQLVSENITQMTPRERKVAVGTRHFKSRIEHRIKQQENRAELSRSILRKSIRKTRQGVVGTKEGNQQNQSEKDQARRRCFYMHHVINPVVVDRIVEHARPEGRKHRLSARIAVQDNKPRHQQQQGGGAKRHWRIRKRIQSPAKRGKQERHERIAIFQMRKIPNRK